MILADSFRGWGYDNVRVFGNVPQTIIVHIESFGVFMSAQLLHGRPHGRIKHVFRGLNMDFSYLSEASRKTKLCCHRPMSSERRRAKRWLIIHYMSLSPSKLPRNTVTNPAVNYASKYLFLPKKHLPVLSALLCGASG